MFITTCGYLYEILKYTYIYIILYYDYNLNNKVIYIPNYQIIKK